MTSQRQHLLPFVLVLALLLTAFPVQAQDSTETQPPSASGSIIFPTRFVPDDAAVSAAAGVQVAPAIAQGGATQLMAWSDGRANTTNTSGLETAYDIYGMRFDAVGAALDAVPFPMAAIPGDQGSPQVAWNGTNWLVMFESYTIHGTGSYYQKSLAFVRVSPSGQVLDPKPVPIFNIVPITGQWALANDGPTWMLAAWGTTTSNAVQVDATTPNQPPVAVAWSSTYGGPAPLDVTTYARGSYDPDGSIGNIQWDYGDGNVYWGATSYNAFQQPGVYNVVVTVWDNRSATDTAHLTIIVTNGGPPVPGDLNGDGHVTVADVSLAANAWGSQPGDPTWDPRLDRDGNHRISVGEVQWVAARWGV